MGQQPNISLAVEDQPRPEPRTAPPRHWSAGRPGDLCSPDDVPWGGAFGTPGPDTGYALRLIAGRPLALGKGERRGNAERAVAILMAARASRLGRAPVAADAEVAELILGYGAESLEAGPAAELGERRRAVLGHGAEGIRRLLEAVDPGVLAVPLGEVRQRAAAGRLIG